LRLSAVPNAGETRAEPVRIRRIEARFAERYGPPTRIRLDPLDELVQTILSQNTNDTNRDRAWAALRERYTDWESVRQAKRREVERTIRVAGLAGQKAVAIQAALERLVDEVGEPSLDHLSGMEDDEAIAYLCGFRGVGLKTAACVLCFALGRSVMPVDTHVHRLGQRLGLLPADIHAEGAHHVLNASVPPELRYPLHMHLIRHGREVCGARRPACDSCVVEDLCPKTGVAEFGP
jgi:endonuclease-3